MPSTDFRSFFRAATGNNPYGYQSTLAEGACESRLISVPTGLGKTAAVVLAWLWNRIGRSSEISNLESSNASASTDAWPRRLVYCLPMRTLVEQSRDEAKKWIDNLHGQGLLKGKPPRVVILMGGEELDDESRDWDIYPEEDAILIGTQDMLLSKALNRGYASARARWPMEFGLLNQDCLWVLDEVQLMDVGLATATQLQAFRREDQLAAKDLRPCATWWMSATLRADWLESADTKSMIAELHKSLHRVPEEERKAGVWEISKPCSHLPLKDAKAWAAEAWKTHLASKGGEHGRVTLLIANSVKAAKELYEALIAAQKKAKDRSVTINLIHSRFRGMERRQWRKDFLARSACKEGADRIIVATQVVEAGVDISASTLFAELAPWPSLVQRFGRAARYGGTAQVFVVDRNPSEKAALPYQLAELEAAREALAFLPDASLAGLSTFEAEHPELLPRLFPYTPKHLLLRRELEELVDTTPDLSGADLDISRFIRSGEERDVLVFWRDIEIAPDSTIMAAREELCAVAMGDARDWLAKDGVKNRAWVWDYIDGAWRSCRKEDIYPGQTIVVAHAAGGYNVTKGWTGEAGDRDFSVGTDKVKESDRAAADATEQSEATSQCNWESIAVHGGHVASVVAEVVAALDLPEAVAQVLGIGARWHDYGKGHPAFQACILPKAPSHPGGSDIAKAPPGAWEKMHQLYRMADGDQRRGFRHELATTIALFAVLERHSPQHPALLGPHLELLAALGQVPHDRAPGAPPTAPEQEVLDLDQPSFDLLAYLACAHHGKVRGAWHAGPADQEYRVRPGDERGLPIHGVREGDTIPALAVMAADGMSHVIPETTLHLEPARIGLSPRTGASWSERVAGLLQARGPFALTYLEALLRAADIRASRMSAGPAPAQP